MLLHLLIDPYYQCLCRITKGAETVETKKMNKPLCVQNTIFQAAFVASTTKPIVRGQI